MTGAFRADPTFDQRYALADLVGYAEGLCKSGALGDVMEPELRRRIAQVLVAFNMPSRTELDAPMQRDMAVIQQAIDRH